MTKDAYYFSHDSNAHKDPKILKLRAKYGWEGYGIYWAIIETLRDQEHHRWNTEDKELLSYSFANGEPIVNQVIDSCIDIGLLSDDGNFIYSDSLNKRMRIKEEKRQKRVEAGKKGAKSRWSDGNAITTTKQSDGNAIAKDGKGKERKGKETKIKETKNNNDYSNEFEQFWDLYPRKVDKAKAYKSFKSAIKKHKPEIIIDGTKRYADSVKNTEKQFIKHGATFLNNESYIDGFEVVEEPVQPSHNDFAKEDYSF